jgi:hypothetical protein
VDVSARLVPVRLSNEWKNLKGSVGPRVKCLIEYRQLI